MIELKFTPNRSCIINDEEFLFFSGYSYLGMNFVKEFTELVKEGMDKYGVLFPSSRISNTRLPLYEEFEADLSRLMQTEATVSFSSGFLAGKTIADILSSYQNIFVAPGTHPAVSYLNSHPADQGFNAWAQTIIDLINSSSGTEFVIICDSINILTSEVHNLGFLKKISAAKKIIVLIDHSHGIGLFNDNHMVYYLPEAGNIEYLFSYSLSKALSLNGGAVSCSSYFADKIREHPNYRASTPINPSMVYAYLKSEGLYRLQRDKLFENIKYLKSKHVLAGILQNNFNLPVFICHKQNAAGYFFANKVIISSFNYPYKHSGEVHRIILSALHTKADIDRLYSLL